MRELFALREGFGIPDLTPEVEVIPAWLYFAGPSVTLMMSALVGVIILHYRSVQNGKLWPDSTVDLLIKQKDDEIKSTKLEAAAQIEAMRAEHDKQLAALVKVADGIRADFAVVLAKADRDIDQWRGAWQITDQASREEWGAAVDEILAGIRTMARWMGAFQSQTGVPQLPPSGGEDRHAG